MATLSILGLYNYDSTIFDLMCWPSEFTQDDKQATINNILMEGAELEILYPDAVFMKSAIAAWSYKEKLVWQRIHTASLLEYNPIENYRRNETESIETSKTEQHSGNDTTSHTGTDTTAHTGTESSTTSNTNTATGSDSGTIDHKVTGYDSNTLVQQSQDSTTGTSSSQDTQTGNSAVTHNTQDAITHNTQDQLTHGEQIQHTGDDARTLLAYGNIGVTTSQEMLSQELEIAPKLNTISAIVDSFIKRFCILVY